MSALLDTEEIIETIKMITLQKLNIRAATLGISLLDCIRGNVEETCDKIYYKIMSYSRQFDESCREVQRSYGVPIVNKRIAVTPISMIIGSLLRDQVNSEKIKVCLKIAETLEKAVVDAGVDYIGGYSCFVHRGASLADEALIESLPVVLSTTKRVFSFINVASTESGINMDMIKRMGGIIKDIAYNTRDANSVGCAKLMVMANAAEGTPFLPGAFHSIGDSDVSLTVGISGPGVIHAVLKNLKEDAPLGDVVEAIKSTSFKVTRAGELIGRRIAEEMKVDFGGVDLSLAPSPEGGNSVGGVVESIGLERFGAPGSVLAIAIIADALKKGGSMASKYVGGQSGVFIPVLEDDIIAKAAGEGALTIDHLKAMSGVCSTGLDMIPIPWDTSPETIAALIGDIIALGVINRKTVGARLIPVYGKKPGEWVDYGGLLGRAPVMEVSRFKSSKLIQRGGRIPAPFISLSKS
ncbi:MAG: PFL family protein [Candidatus Odinarchaeum yellowstonii]|uniref:PFL family protein n=1 Tax=Odinarchaeota yellowstonii (strain LCB_4) TaxID=1841599 RepID=A0AAF0IB77_ODILC|nr:MAG: PFL family protein [Candidatus Odinarchaeum yellowstonii]